MYNKLFFISLVLLLNATTQLYAQKYPILVPSGTELLLSPATDSLWVLSNNQFNNALADSKELRLVREELTTQKEIIVLLKQKSAEQDTLVKTLEKDRDFYVNTWKTCDSDLEKMVKATRKQKTFTRIALASIPVAFLIGFFIK